MTLRTATSSDLPWLRDLWEHPENGMFLTPFSGTDAEAAIEAGDLYVWEEGSELMGFAKVVSWVPRSFGISELAVSQQGRGTGRAMLTVLVDHLFSGREAHRLSLDAASDNWRAIRLFRKLGFVQEGVYRQCWQRPDGIWVDCPHFSLLRQEWDSRSVRSGSRGREAS